MTASDTGTAPLRGHAGNAARLRARSRWSPRAMARAVWAGGKAWIGKGGPRLGAAVAFYSLFALSPLVVLATAIAGVVLGAEAVRTEFVAQVSDLVGADVARSLEGMITSAWRPAAGWLAALAGLATLLVGATGVLVELRAALDTMLHDEAAPARRASAIGRLVRARVAALALVLGFGFLLIISLMLSTVLAAVGAWLSGRYPALQALLSVTDLLVSVIVLSMAFAAIIRWLPSRQPPWAVVGIAALLSAALFTVGKYLVSLYLAQAAFVSAYGAAGSLAVLLIWIYFTCQLMLLSVSIAREAAGEPAAARAGAPPAAVAA